MVMPHGQYQATCVRRTLPKKYGVLLLSTLGLLAWVLAVPSKNSYAIKSVIDQAMDQGYSDQMVRETAGLFPDSRALLRARELSVPPHPIAEQALSDYDRRALEERIYNAILDRFSCSGMDVATLLVTYLGQAHFKVVVSVRTKELPYPQIRLALERMRALVEDVLHTSFKGFELAELSSFTVLNRRNGRYYEYPVLYNNLALPFTLPGPERECPPTTRAFPWGPRPWEAGSKAKHDHPAPAESPAAPSATASPRVQGATTTRPPRTLSQGAYTTQDFYGAPPAPDASRTSPASH